MAHIAPEEGIPGILGPMKFRPETIRIHAHRLGRKFVKGGSIYKKAVVRSR
jgi:hypothetical protein